MYFDKSRSLLEFKKPTVASNKGHSNGVGMLIVPVSLIRSSELNANNLKKWNKMPSAYRNVIAWYLKGAGVPVKDIATFLSISSSRASALITKVRRLVYVHSTIHRLDKDFYKESVSPEVFKAHCLKQQYKEMIDAEYVLSMSSLFGIQEDHYVVSEALRLGKQAYLESTEKLAGVTCDCFECSVVNNMINEYVNS
jgi:hypothetical protein